MLELMAPPPTPVPWYDSQIVAVGGTLLGALGGYAIRPFVEKRIRRDKAAEDVTREWTAKGQRLAADLTTLHDDAMQYDQLDLINDAKNRWRSDLQSRTTTVAKFSPSAAVRHAAEKLLEEFDAMLVFAGIVHRQEKTSGTPNDQDWEFFIKHQTQSEKALNDLIYALGGPPPPRDN